MGGISEEIFLRSIGFAVKRPDLDTIAGQAHSLLIRIHDKFLFYRSVCAPKAQILPLFS